MDKQKIISAIQQPEVLRITFRHNSDGARATRNVAPYGIFPQINRETNNQEDLLRGYARPDFRKSGHIVSIYLSNIQNVQETGEKFDREQLKQLVQAHNPPNILRNW